MREIKKAAQYDGLGKMGLSGGHPLLVSTFELGRWGKSSTKEFERRKGPPPKCPNLSPCTIVLVLLMSPIILFSLLSIPNSKRLKFEVCVYPSRTSYGLFIYHPFPVYRWHPQDHGDDL